jgi:TonB family protein
MKSFAVVTALFAFTGCAASTSGTSATAAGTIVRAPVKVSGDIALAELEQHQILQLERRGQVRTDVAVCVSPDGSVSEAAIVAGSGIEAYDRALLDSVRQWTYQRYAAPGLGRICQTVSIVYRGA